VVALWRAGGGKARAENFPKVARRS